jgi:general secretion pathway protein A
MTLNNKKLLSLYGLKWNPFQPDVPTEALYRRPELDSFIWRVENLVLDGGFATVTGDPGHGKSVVLRLIDEQLKGLREVTVARMDRPQSGLSDFYREVGEIFGIELRASNRYGGFKSLRKKWKSHIESTLLRPVLLIDESQDMPSVTLSELRLLMADEFDSRRILTVILAGDLRLAERFKAPDLLPLARRQRVKLTLAPLADDDMTKMLEHTLAAAGNRSLMTTGIIEAIVAHSGGNPSTMMTTCDELLARAVATEQAQIDEKSFFDMYQPPKPRSPKPRNSK